MTPEAAAPAHRPSAEGEALLRAALLPEVDAHRSWSALVDVTRVEDFEGASHCLLPLVYLNLQEPGIENRALQKLKGTYRFTWYHNVSLLEELASLLQAFREAGIEVLIRRDVALALRYYDRPGSRQINTVHLLVRPHAAASAIDLLERRGLQAGVPSPRLLLHGGVSCPFADTSGQRILLWWRMLRPEVDDDAVWSASHDIAVGREQVRAVGATDALLDCCGVGPDWEATSPTQRMADAATILRVAADQVNWDRLLLRAHEAAMSMALRDLLEYVSDVLQAPVPASARAPLITRHASTLDQLEYAQLRGASSPLTTWRIHRHRYRRLRLRAGPLGFPRYLQQTWGYGSIRPAAIYAARAAARALHRRSGQPGVPPTYMR